MTRAVLLATLLAACGPSLYAQSSAPPGRTASFEDTDGHYDLDISQGIAIAISCDTWEGACKDVVVGTEDESIADVKAASLVGTSSLVVVAKAPGMTRVKVSTSKGSKTIHVKVKAPPLTGEPAKVARP